MTTVEANCMSGTGSGQHVIHAEGRPRSAIRNTGTVNGQ